MLISHKILLKGLAFDNIITPIGYKLVTVDIRMKYITRTSISNPSASTGTITVINVILALRVSRYFFAICAQ